MDFCAGMCIHKSSDMCVVMPAVMHTDLEHPPCGAVAPVQEHSCLSLQPDHPSEGTCTPCTHSSAACVGISTTPRTPCTHSSAACVGISPTHYTSCTHSSPACVGISLTHHTSCTHSSPAHVGILMTHHTPCIHASAVHVGISPPRHTPCNHASAVHAGISPTHRSPCTNTSTVRADISPTCLQELYTHACAASSAPFDRIWSSSALAGSGYTAAAPPRCHSQRRPSPSDYLTHHTPCTCASAVRAGKSAMCPSLSADALPRAPLQSLRYRSLSPPPAQPSMREGAGCSLPSACLPFQHQRRQHWPAEIYGRSPWPPGGRLLAIRLYVYTHMS